MWGSRNVEEIIVNDFCKFCNNSSISTNVNKIMNHFEVPIVDDLTHPLEFSPAKLPLFYASVLRAWRSLQAADPSCLRKSCLSPVNRPTKLSYLRNPALVTALIKFVLSTRFLPEAFDFYRTLTYMRTP